MGDKLSFFSSYHNPVNIISGPDSVYSVKKNLPDGKILLITTDIFTQNGIVAKFTDIIGKKNLVVFDNVLPNPELDDIDDFVSVLKKEKFASIIALGGGSVLDFAKATSVLLADKRNRSLSDLLRGGEAQTPTEKIFLVAIPTTSGTGSEVTPFATIWDSATNKKYSLAGDIIFPSLTLLDPVLTVGLSPEITLFTGLDSISHSLESLWNKNKSPVSEAFALKSLRLSVQCLPAVLVKLDGVKLRTDMQWASTLGGMSISQTKTAIAHSVSYPLTLKFGIPHGLACSFTLCSLIDYYIENNNPVQFILDLFIDVKKMLETFELRDKILKYAQMDQILSLVDEMYSPGRADNYINKIDYSFIERLVSKSLR